MIEFCRTHASTKQGQIKLGLLFSIVFICATVFGMTVLVRPYAVFATGEKVADPWVVSIDGNPVVIVESEEAGKAVETGLRLHYGGTDFEEQQDVPMLNEITVTKYNFDDKKVHPVVMNGPEAVDYIIGLNEAKDTPVVGFETTRYVTSEEEIPYDTIALEDDEFLEGNVEITQEGVEGLKEITSLETLINGEVVATQVVSEKVIEEPVSEVVVTGVMPEPEPEPEPEPTPTYSARSTRQQTSSSSKSSSNSGGSGGHVPSGGGVDTAYAMIGTPYVWGGMSSGGVDCSGLVNYCYGGARGRTTYNMISSLQSSGDWKTSMSELEYGDLVFPEYNHVGIYIGDGMMIHATMSKGCVVKAPVYNFIGGGTY